MCKNSNLQLVVANKVMCYKKKYICLLNEKRGEDFFFVEPEINKCSTNPISESKA
jgi:hypothetical protein